MTRLIGQVCKCGNAFSLLVLIGRAAWPQNNWHNRIRSGPESVSKLNLSQAFQILKGDVFSYLCLTVNFEQIQFSAAIAKRQHPLPSRTRKLSSSAPMVLPGKLGGRVGRRRNFFQNPESHNDSGFFIPTLLLPISAFPHMLQFLPETPSS
jgi:hypothetical protein